MGLEGGRPLVVIHANAVQSIAAAVGAYSIKKRTVRPDAFDLRIMRLEETAHLARREGQRYVSRNSRLTWRNRDSQSHSLLRMMVPQMMGYQGRALVLDPDIVALGDVAELLYRDMEGRAIVCRFRPRQKGQPPRFYSSAMLLDCRKLTHWRWDEQIDEMFRGRLDPLAWMALELEDPESIGSLEEEWNQFDTLTEQTRLLHFTERITQPWKTGLPIDFDLNHIGAQPLAPSSPFARVRRAAGRLLHPAPPQRVYRSHPDPRLERYFFSLLRECLENGAVDETAVRDAIRRGYLRPDAFKLIEAAP